MIIKKYKEFKKLNDQEVLEQTENIFNFLKKTHGFIENREENSKVLFKKEIGAGNLAIELRALKRDEKSPVYNNFRLFKFVDTEKERLFKYLQMLNNKEIPYCLYYSVFTFDNQTLAISQSGNSAEKWNNRIALNNAIATKVLIMDFDNITEEEFILERLKLSRLALDTLDVFTGHGFQSIILLKETCWDKDILKKFTNLLLSKGFKVDPKIKDAARIMRMPYAFNSKEMGNSKYLEKNIIETSIYYDTNERFSVEEIFTKLEKLETVVDIQKEIDKNIDFAKKASKRSALTIDENLEQIEGSVMKKPHLEIVREKDNLNNLEDNIELLKELYPMLKVDELPKTVRQMLMGFRRGYANNMLFFLTLYLKEQGYPKSTIQEAMLILSDQDRYNYPWEREIVGPEVNRFYYNQEYSSKGIFFKELQQFGFIEYKLIDKSILTINNYVFNNLDKISSSAFYIYLKLLLEQDITGDVTFTLDDISKISGISKRNISEHVSGLVKVGFIDKKKANRRLGEEYKYYLTSFMLDNLGFTKINKGSTKLLLTMVDFKQINPTQLSICMYFKYLCYGGKNESNISQASLAKALGVGRTTIVESFKKIEETKLIHREKEELINDFKFKYNYSIHF